MGKYTQISEEIIANVGGKNNIAGVTHCITRLRFNLKDEGKANDEAFNNMNGVLKILKSGGQYQVVIGSHVGEVYQDICETLGIQVDKAPVTEADNKAMSLKDKILDYITSIINPILPFMAACGIIGGINSLLVFLGLYANDSGIYTMISGISQVIFYFFPIALGYSTAKKLGMTPYLGMVIGMCLVYPNFQGVDINLFGLNINTSYTSSFLPVIIIVALAVPFERLLKKIVPKAVQFFVVPAIVLVVVVPIGFAIIGPVANTIGNSIGGGITALISLNLMAAGLILGGFWQIFIVLGIHSAIMMPSIINMLGGGSDYLLAFTYGITFAQMAVCMVVWLKTKNKDLKSTALSSWIAAGLAGITEPALYGVSLPNIKMFIVSCIGGALGGAVGGLLNFKCYQLGGMGIIGIACYFNPDNYGSSIIGALTVIAVSFISAFVIGMFVYKDK